MITVHASRHPLRDEWLEPAEVDPGQTIAEICGTDQVFAWINGRELTEHMISHMRLKDGGTVVIRVAPQSGNIFRSILSIGIAIAAVYTGGLAAGALGLAEGTAAYSAAATAFGAAFAISGHLQHNLVKP